MKTTNAAIGAVAVTCLLMLSGCGDGENAYDVLETSTPSASAKSDGSRPAAPDTSQFEKIKECLDAAGLEDKMPMDRPTDRPTEMPAEPPSGEDAPEGAGPGAMQDPEVQKALKACGIDMPERQQQPSTN